MAKKEKIVDLKSKAEKITDEQLEKIQKMINDINKTQFELGTMELKKHEMMHKIAGSRDADANAGRASKRIRNRGREHPRRNNKLRCRS